MKNRIVVFGATGYTGRLTVEALVKRGIKPVIAGRNVDKLSEISREFGGLEYAAADINDFGSVKSLLREKDVLITTVGPFVLYGQAALSAAVAAGAHYIDSTGEIAFARRVIEDYDSIAEEAGVTLQTAAGYDFIPGNCAGAAVLEKAGEAAVRVDIGYFDSGSGKLVLSQGTLASLATAVLEKGVFWHRGKLREKAAGTKLKRFKSGKNTRPAISISSTEHYFLPAKYKNLKDLNVYLGWFGWLSYPLVATALVYSVLSKIPGISRLLKSAMPRLFKSKGKGPDRDNRSVTGSHIIAIAYDRDDNVLARADMKGVNGYTFTANMLAIAAEKTAEGSLKVKGAAGPAALYGVDNLIKACEEAGLSLTLFSLEDEKQSPR